MFIVLIVCALLTLSTTTLQADQGCYIGNKIYFNKTGTTSFFGLGTRYLYDPQAFYEDFTGNCTSAIPMGDRSTMATQGIWGTTIQCGYTGDSYSMAARGYVWNFDVIVCPVDDYVFGMLAAVAGIGVYRLKRRR